MGDTYTHDVIRCPLRNNYNLIRKLVSDLGLVRAGFRVVGNHFEAPNSIHLHTFRVCIIRFCSLRKKYKSFKMGCHVRDKFNYFPALVPINRHILNVNRTTKAFSHSLPATINFIFSLSFPFDWISFQPRRKLRWASPTNLFILLSHALPLVSRCRRDAKHDACANIYLTVCEDVGDSNAGEMEVHGRRSLYQYEYK